MGVGFRDVGIRYVKVFFLKREEGVRWVKWKGKEDEMERFEERCGCDAALCFEGN